MDRVSLPWTSKTLVANARVRLRANAGRPEVIHMPGKRVTEEMFQGLPKARGCYPRQGRYPAAESKSRRISRQPNGDLEASRPVCSDLMPIGLSKSEHGVGRGRVVHEERGAWSHVMFYVFI
jgi:hypothetical protein